MFNERILTLSVGSGQLALGEFSARSGATPVLQNYTFAPITIDLAGAPQDLSVEIEKTLQGMLASSGIKPAKVNLALSGQMVYTRFFKVAADTADNIKQMVQFEVEQNVPFPMNEVIWGYQLIGEVDAGEQQVMIVAAKQDVVNAVVNAITNVGLDVEVVDVAHLAIFNAARFNYPEWDDCSLIVDLGAKSTNLIFVDQGSIYCRTLPVAGNTITAEIAKTFTISTEEAEALKLERGLVARGGAFVIEDPELDHLSKVIRNVMTRLNAEVTRSINFYRSQQGGSAPARILLTGGTAQLPYLKEFVSEKMQVEVDFLNPFNQIPYAETIDQDAIAVDVFGLSDLVGLALRKSLACPIEINLLSNEIIARKIFRKKIPFFAVTVIGFLIMTACWLGYIARMGNIYTSQAETLARDIENYNFAQSKMDRENKKVVTLTKQADTIAQLMQAKFKWNDIAKAVSAAMPKGIWIESLTTSFEAPPAPTSSNRYSRKKKVDAPLVKLPSKLTFTLRGWKKEVEAATKENRRKQGNITVNDYIIKQLSASPIFDANGVIQGRGKTFGSGIDSWLFSSTINATFAKPDPNKTKEGRQ